MLRIAILTPFQVFVPMQKTCVSSRIGVGFAGVYYDVLTAGVYICIAFINQSSYHLHGQTASEKVIIDGCGLANRAVIHEWFRISPSFPLIS